MIIYLSKIESFYFYYYPYQIVRTSKLNHQKIMTLLSKTKEVIVHIDTSYEPYMQAYPLTLTNQYNHTYDNKEVCIDAPFPNVIKKTPITNLNLLLPKRNYGIHGIIYADLLSLLQYNLTFQYNRLFLQYSYSEKKSHKIKNHLTTIYQYQKYLNT